MANLGITILNAVKKSYPYLKNGLQTMPKNNKFSLLNPYILEAIPENAITNLSIFEGKKLNTVCRILDNPDYSEILRRYNQFCSRYNKGFDGIELQNLYKKAFPNIKVPTDINNDAMVFLNGLDAKFGSQFDAHGIAKISITDQLRQLNELLAKGIDKNKNFYTLPLVEKCKFGAVLGAPGGHAYRDGSFIITSGKGKTLVNDGIENVIVNDAYYSIIDDLKLKFPNINFVKAENAVEYFTKLAEKA